jgi:hypothetical protein
MDIGMLWFDDSSRTFAEKVRRAADYYKEKYGREPTLCLVNPDTWDDAGSKKVPVEMRQARLVLPNHFWIGVEDDLRRVHRPEKKTARAERAPAPAPALQAERAA